MRSSLELKWLRVWWTNVHSLPMAIYHCIMGIKLIHPEDYIKITHFDFHQILVKDGISNLDWHILKPRHLIVDITYWSNDNKGTTEGSSITF